jgi:hypothetical protein
MKNILLCLLLLPLIAGCGQDFGAPLVSGELLTFENRQESGRAALSQEQLQGLSRWLEQHRSGWYGLITPASSEPPQLQLNLTHADGKTTTVKVIVQTNGARYLRLTTSEGWAYRSAGGVFKSWAAARSLSDQELAAIESLLGHTA